MLVAFIFFLALLFTTYFIVVMTNFIMNTAINGEYRANPIWAILPAVFWALFYYFVNN